MPESKNKQGKFNDEYKYINKYCRNCGKLHNQIKRIISGGGEHS